MLTHIAAYLTLTFPCCCESAWIFQQQGRNTKCILSHQSQAVSCHGSWKGPTGWAQWARGTHTRSALPTGSEAKSGDIAVSSGQLTLARWPTSDPVG